MPGIRAVKNRLKVYADKPLRMQGLLKKRKESLEEFLVNFFTLHNSKRETLFVETKTIQTEPGKRRSIGDIFAICQYYYPECTIQEVTKIVYDVLPVQVPRFRSSMCSQIKKRVFYQGKEDQKSEIYGAETPDEFEMTIPDWKKLK